MKQIFTILTLLCFVLTVQAQNNITVVGSIIDVNGDPVVDHTVYIATDSTGVWEGYFANVQTNMDGEFLFNFDTPISQGQYWVSTMDCDNSWMLHEGFYFPNAVITVNFLYCDNVIPPCSAYVQADTLQGTEIWDLTAISTQGIAPFTYQWSNGDVGQTITVTEAGEYCVTITDVNNCAASDCFLVQEIFDCNLSLVVQTMPAGGLCAQTFGGAQPYVYEWDNGNTDNCIFPNTIGDFCVTVTDFEGCTESLCVFYDGGMGGVDSCFVDINVVQNGAWLSASGTGVAPFTYQWNTGATDSSIAIQPNMDTYCVVMTDASGCVAEECITIIQPDPCGVVISEDSINTALVLTAEPWGVAPFAYTWSTGETTESINYSEPGTYCVTVVDNNNCEATACLQVFCNLNVNIELTASGEFCATPIGGSAPYLFEWDSLNNNTPCLTPTDEGWYCLGVTDVNGCVYDTCVYFQPTMLTNTIWGTIILGDSLTSATPNTNGWARLIQYNENDETLTEVAYMTWVITNPISGGTSYYQFDDVAPGTYLVKAGLNVGSPGFDENMPTYYQETLYWNEATEIELNGVGNAVNASFALLAGVNPGGPGFIGGYVSEGANFQSGETEGVGDPVEGASILLLDANESPVTHVESNEEGWYEFPSVAYGTYKVVIEIVGFEQAHYWVTLGPDNESSTNNDFEVNSTFVTTGIAEIINSESAVSIYPNPANAELNVQIEALQSAAVQLTITTVTGQMTQTQTLDIKKGKQAIQLDINNLANGVYFMNINSGNEVITKKFVKL